MARAAAAGVERLLVPGYDLPSSRRALELAEQHPAVIRAAVGIHPHFVADASAADWTELAGLAASPEAVAVGEIGLDYFRNLSPPDVQREAFDRQLALAAAARQAGAGPRPRRARRHPRRAARAGTGRGVLHAFSGDADLALEMTAAGFLVSFALPLTFSSAAGPRAAAAAIPAGSFLVETDSPWLAPGGAGARNEPTTAVRVAVELARLRDVPPEEIATQVGAAYDRLLGG